MPTPLLPRSLNIPQETTHEFFGGKWHHASLIKMAQHCDKLFIMSDSGGCCCHGNLNTRDQGPPGLICVLVFLVPL